jgi:hypothetical protein
MAQTYEVSKAGKPGRPGLELRPKSPTINFHSHVGVPAEVELVKPHMDPQASPLVRFANAETKALNQKQEADVGARRPRQAPRRPRYHGRRHAGHQAAAAAVPSISS